MNTAIYARVSSEAQEKQQTIESQLAELRAFAEAQGLGLPVELVDDGYSGAMLERPELDRLRDAVSAGEVDTILCLCPDRLSRDFLHVGILVEEFAKHGARVIFLNQPSEDTPENRLLVQIQGAVSQYERTKILDRTRRGRQHKARQGLMPGGQAPYGYDYVPGDGPRWRVNDEEAAVVREVFRLLNEDGRTLSSLAKELVARGTRTKRGGLTWGYSTLHRVLKNEAYAGTAHFFKEAPVEPKDRRSDSTYRRRLKTSQRTRDRSEWIEVPVPAIIDRATFDRAQERLRENAHFAPRNNKCNFYLLRGLLRCGHCGYSLTGQKKDSNTYYECRGHDPLGLKLVEKCRARSVRTDRIEPVVWEAVKGLVDDPQVIFGQFEVEQEDLVQHAASAGDMRKALQKRLAELDAEEMQVVRLFRGGKIGEAVVDAQLQEIGGERGGLEEQLQAVVYSLEAKSRLEDDSAIVRRFCEDFRDSFLSATGEEKQQVLRLLVDRIEVDPDGDHGKLHGMIPLPSAIPVLLSHCQGIPLSPTTRQALELWQERRKGLGLKGGPLFCTISEGKRQAGFAQGEGELEPGQALNPRYVRELVKRLANKAGIERRVHPHMLRHTALTALYDKTRDLRMVQQVAGHTTSRMTERYTHVHPLAIAAAMGAIENRHV